MVLAKVILYYDLARFFDGSYIANCAYNFLRFIYDNGIGIHQRVLNGTRE